MPFPLHAQTMGFLDIFNSIPIYNKNMQWPFQNNSLQRIFTLPNLSLKKLKAFKTKNINANICFIYETFFT